MPLKQDSSRNVFLHFWDALVWGLVAFPFLTGGIWFSRPGLFIELSDVGIPVLIVGLLGLLLHRWKRIPLSQASSARLASRLWNFWMRSLTHSPTRTLWSATLGVGTIGAVASLRRHWALESHSFDLGIFTNTLWNLTHGHGYISSVKGGINLFSDHQSPLFWLLAPVFALFPRPETLLVIQAFALAAGGVACFHLGRQFEKRESWIPAALPWLYWLYLPFRNANSFDFHPEVLMLPLFLAAIAGIQSAQISSRIWGILAFFLALGAKESAGPVAAGIALGWALGAGPEATRSFTRRTAIPLGILGALIFLVDIRVVPRLLGAHYAYQGAFAQYGATLPEILLAPLRQPGLFFKQLFGPERLRFLAWTLGPLAFIPLLSPRAFIAALPGYLMLFLSTGEHRINLGYHYGIEPGVGLFFALPGALLAAQKFPRFARYLPLWVLFWAIGMSGRSELFRIRKFTADPQRAWISEQVLPCVDPSASFVASETLVPHLSTRHWVQAEDLPLSPQEPVSCWITKKDGSHWPLRSADEALNRIPADFKETWRCGSVSVYERSHEGPPCLRCQPSCNLE